MELKGEPPEPIQSSGSHSELQDGFSEVLSCTRELKRMRLRTKTSQNCLVRVKKNIVFSASPAIWH